MFRPVTSRLQKAAINAAKRTYTTENKAAQGLAEEALAQKTKQTKATMPKSDKKPSKAAGESDNKLKQNALIAGSITGLALGGLFYYGRPFEDGRADKYVEENPVVAAYSRCVDRFTEFRESWNEPAWKTILPDPLPGEYGRPYTLIINMDETLVYSYWTKEHGWRHAKRPGVDYFLSYLSNFYEIVIFTSQPAMNAEPILEKLDPYRYAQYRIYRDGTRYIDGKYVKDLSHLNRDLSKVIIMDSNPEAFSLQPENGIALKPWKGEPNDTGLLEYIPFLEAMVVFNANDLRVPLKSFEGKHLPAEWAKYEAQMKEQFLLQSAAETKKSSRSLGSLLGGGGSTGGAPVFILDRWREEVRGSFVNDYETNKKLQDEFMAKEMEKNTQMLKDMKMSILDLMTQTASGQPITPEQLQQQQQAEK